MPMGAQFSAHKWKHYTRQHFNSFLYVIPMNDLPATLSLKKLSVWATIREALEFWRDHWTILRHGVLLGTLLGGLGLFLEEIISFPGTEEGYGYYEILSGMISIIGDLLGLTSILFFFPWQFLVIASF